ncbi:MAG: hypothetical protein WDW38_010120 [Sanguina aurantia]
MRDPDPPPRVNPGTIVPANTSVPANPGRRLSQLGALTNGIGGLTRGVTSGIQSGISNYTSGLTGGISNYTSGLVSNLYGNLTGGLGGFANRTGDYLSGNETVAAGNGTLVNGTLAGGNGTLATGTLGNDTMAMDAGLATPTLGANGTAPPNATDAAGTLMRRLLLSYTSGVSARLRSLLSQPTRTVAPASDTTTDTPAPPVKSAAHPVSGRHLLQGIAENATATPPTGNMDMGSGGGNSSLLVPDMGGGMSMMNATTMLNGTLANNMTMPMGMMNSTTTGMSMMNATMDNSTAMMMPVGVDATMPGMNMTMPMPDMDNSTAMMMMPVGVDATMPGMNRTMPMPEPAAQPMSGRHLLQGDAENATAAPPRGNMTMDSGGDNSSLLVPDMGAGMSMMNATALNATMMNGTLAGNMTMPMDMMNSSMMMMKNATMDNSTAMMTMPAAGVNSTMPGMHMTMPMPEPAAQPMSGRHLLQGDAENATAASPMGSMTLNSGGDNSSLLVPDMGAGMSMMNATALNATMMNGTLAGNMTMPMDMMNSSMMMMKNATMDNSTAMMTMPAAGVNSTMPGMHMTMPMPEPAAQPMSGRHLLQGDAENATAASPMGSMTLNSGGDNSSLLVPDMGAGMSMMNATALNATMMNGTLAGNMTMPMDMMNSSMMMMKNATMDNSTAMMTMPAAGVNSTMPGMHMTMPMPEPAAQPMSGRHLLQGNAENATAASPMGSMTMNSGGDNSSLLVPDMGAGMSMMNATALNATMMNGTLAGNMTMPMDMMNSSMMMMKNATMDNSTAMMTMPAAGVNSTMPGMHMTMPMPEPAAQPMSGRHLLQGDAENATAASPMGSMTLNSGGDNSSLLVPDMGAGMSMMNATALNATMMNGTLAGNMTMPMDMMNSSMMMMKNATMDNSTAMMTMPAAGVNSTMPGMHMTMPMPEPAAQPMSGRHLLQGNAENATAASPMGSMTMNSGGDNSSLLVPDMGAGMSMMNATALNATMMNGTLAGNMTMPMDMMNSSMMMMKNATMDNSTAMMTMPAAGVNSTMPGMHMTMPMPEPAAQPMSGRHLLQGDAENATAASPMGSMTLNSGGDNSSLLVPDMGAGMSMMNATALNATMMNGTLAGNMTMPMDMMNSSMMMMKNATMDNSTAMMTMPAAGVNSTMPGMHMTMPMPEPAAQPMSGRHLLQGNAENATAASPMGSMTMNSGDNSSLLVPDMGAGMSMMNATTMNATALNGTLANTTMPTPMMNSTTAMMMNATMDNSTAMMMMPVGVDATMPGMNRTMPMPEPEPSVAGRRLLQDNSTAAPPPDFTPQLSVSPTRLTVSSTAPEATATTPEGNNITLTADPVSGNVTLVYDGTVVILDAPSLNVDSAANVTAGINGTSLAVTLGANETLLLVDVFPGQGGVGTGANYTLPGAALLAPAASGADFNLTSQPVTVTATPVPANSSGGYAVFVQGPNLSRLSQVSAASSSPGRHLLQDMSAPAAASPADTNATASNTVTAAPPSNATSSPTPVPAVVPVPSSNASFVPEMSSSSNSSLVPESATTVLFVGPFALDASALTPGGHNLTAMLDPAGGNLTLTYENTTVVIEQPTLNISSNANFSITINGPSLTIAGGGNLTLVLMNPFGAASSTGATGAGANSTTPSAVLLTPGQGGVPTPVNENVAVTVTNNSMGIVTYLVAGATPEPMSVPLVQSPPEAVSGRRLLQANSTAAPLPPDNSTAAPPPPPGSITALLDPPSGKLTVSYMNTTVVVLGSTFNVSRDALLTIGVQDTSMSVNIGGNATLLLSGAFGGNATEAGQAPAPLLLSQGADGSLTPLDVNITATPSTSADGAAVLTVAGPGSAMPASAPPAVGGRRLLQDNSTAAMPAPDNSTTSSAMMSPDNSTSPSIPSNITLLSVSPASPNATAATPSGDITASLDAPSGNLTVSYMNTTVIILGSTFNVSSDARVTIGVQDTSMSVSTGSNATLLLSGVFSNATDAGAAPAPLLLAPGPGGALSPLDVNITSAPADGATVVSGAAMPAAPAAAANGRRLLQDNSTGTPVDATPMPGAPADNSTTMQSANTTKPPITLLSVSAASPNATATTPAGELTATLDAASGNLTVNFMNTSVLILGSTFNVSSAANITLGVQQTSLSVNVGTNATLLLENAFSNSSDSSAEQGTAPTPLLLSSGAGGTLVPLDSNITATPSNTSTGAVLVVTGPGSATSPTAAESSAAVSGRRSLLQEFTSALPSPNATALPTNHTLLPHPPSGRRLLQDSSSTSSPDNTTASSSTAATTPEPATSMTGSSPPGNETITLLTINAATPTANATTPGGDVVTVAFDPASSNLTITHLNTSVVILAGTFGTVDVSGAGNVTIGVQGSSLSVASSPNATLLIADVFTAAGNGSERGVEQPPPDALLLVLGPDGVQAPLENANITVTPSSSGSGPVVVTGPGPGMSASPSAASANTSAMPTGDARTTSTPADISSTDTTAPTTSGRKLQMPSHYTTLAGITAASGRRLSQIISTNTAPTGTDDTSSTGSGSSTSLGTSTRGSGSSVGVSGTPRVGPSGGLTRRSASTTGSTPGGTSSTTTSSTGGSTYLDPTAPGTSGTGRRLCETLPSKTASTTSPTDTTNIPASKLGTVNTARGTGSAASGEPGTTVPSTRTPASTLGIGTAGASRGSANAVNSGRRMLQITSPLGKGAAGGPGGSATGRGSGSSSSTTRGSGLTTTPGTVTGSADSSRGSSRATTPRTTTGSDATDVSPLSTGASGRRSLLQDSSNATIPDNITVFEVGGLPAQGRDAGSVKLQGMLWVVTVLPPITLLSASPASPSTNITTPAGDLLQLSLDPSAGSITVTYKNSTLVVDGASVGFNSSATIVIGLEDPALSMTDGGNTTLLLTNAFGLGVGDSAGYSEPVIILLGMGMDGNLTALNQTVNSTTTTNPAAGMNTTLVTGLGPGMQAPPPSAAARRLLQNTNETASDNTASISVGPVTNSSAQVTVGGVTNVTLLTVTPSDPSANTLTAAGDNFTVSLDPTTGNLTVIFDNSTIIVDGNSLFQTNVTAPGSNLTAAVSSSSLAVNAGTNLTLLVAGVFNQSATAGTPVTLLHSNPGGPSYPLPQNITATAIPSAAGSGNSTLLIAAATGGK